MSEESKSSDSEDKEEEIEPEVESRTPPKYIYSYGRALEPKFSNPSIAGYYRPWRFTDKKVSGVSKVFYARSRDFRISLDLGQFPQENVSVKLSNNILVVEAHHGTLEDHLGKISRKFKRKYKTPPDVKLTSISGKYKKGFLILWGERDLEMLKRSGLAKVEEETDSESLKTKDLTKQTGQTSNTADPTGSKKSRKKKAEVIIPIAHSPLTPNNYFVSDGVVARLPKGNE